MASDLASYHARTLPSPWRAALRAIDWRAMAASATRLGAFAIGVAAVVFYLGAVAFRKDLVTLSPEALERLTSLGVTRAAFSQLIGWLELGFVLTSAGIGCAIFLGKTRGWYGTFVGLTLATAAIALPTTGPEMVAEKLSVDAFAYAVAMFGWTLFLLFLYLFPNGRFTPGWTKPLAVAWVLFQIVAVAFRDTPLDPYGSTAASRNLVWFGWLLTGVVAQVVGYVRLADHEQRQQTKLVVLGIAVGVGCFYALAFPRALFPTAPMPVLEIVAPLGMYVAALLVPVTIGISVRRHHLWDVDIIVNRALVYALLTAVVAGVYAAVIKFTQTAFLALTGDESEAAVVITTLVLVTTFTPIKTWLERLVGRFFKERPDSTVALDAYGDEVEEVLQVIDPRLVAQRMVDEVAEAFHTRGVALELARDGELETVAVAEPWDGLAAIELPVYGGVHATGVLRIGPRRNGTPYTERECATLERTADLLGRALELSSILVPARAPSLPVPAADRPPAARRAAVTRRRAPRSAPRPAGT